MSHTVALAHWSTKCVLIRMKTVPSKYTIYFYLSSVC